MILGNVVYLGFGNLFLSVSFRGYWIVAFTSVSLRFLLLLNAHMGSSVKSLVSVLLVCSIGQNCLITPIMLGLLGLYVVTNTWRVLTVLGLISRSSSWLNCAALIRCWFRIYEGSPFFGKRGLGICCVFENQCLLCRFF